MVIFHGWGRRGGGAPLVDVSVYETILVDVGSAPYI